MFFKSREKPEHMSEAPFEERFATVEKSVRPLMASTAVGLVAAVFGMAGLMVAMSLPFVACTLIGIAVTVTCGTALEAARRENSISARIQRQRELDANFRSLTTQASAAPPSPPPAPDLSSEFRNGTKKSLAVRTLQLKNACAQTGSMERAP